MSPKHPSTLVIKMAQIKIIASKDTVDKFKRIVLAKHGKLQLSAEGEEALRLYIKRYEKLLGGLGPRMRIVSRRSAAWVVRPNVRMC